MSDSSKSNLDQSAPVTLRQMIHGYIVSQAIYVAAKLSISDQLVDGPRDCNDLARFTATDPHALYRLMRALASVGLFHEDNQSRFHLTDMGQYLRSDIPESVRDESLLFGAEPYRACGDLLRSVLTGQPAFDHLFGVTHIEYLGQNAEAREIFNRAMTQMAKQVTREIVANCDFSGIDKLVDIGGGDGALLAGILVDNPEIQGVLYELIGGAEGAVDVLAREGVLDRVQLLAGDALLCVPPGGDAYIMKSVLHLLDFESACKLLDNCRQSMAIRGKLLIVERVIPVGDRPFWGKFVDLVMLAVTGGCERSQAEYDRILTATHFRQMRISELPSGFSIIEAVCI